MKIKIERRSTNEANISKRNIRYDIMIDGVKTTTFTDIHDAMDYKNWLTGEEE